MIFFYVAQSCSLFHLPYTVPILVGALIFLWPICSSFGIFHSHVLFLHFVSHSNYLYFSIFLSNFFFNISPSVGFSKSVLGNDPDKSAKDRVLKTETDVLLFEEQDGSRKVVGLATMSDARMTSCDDFWLSSWHSSEPWAWLCPNSHKFSGNSEG